MGEPLPVRGGRARRYFQLTGAGARALEQARTAARRLWLAPDLGPSRRDPTSTPPPSGRLPPRPPSRKARSPPLIADVELRDAVLGDLAETFDAHCAEAGRRRPAVVLREAWRSAPALAGRRWWPARRQRARRLGRLGAAVAGGLLLLQCLALAAQLLAAQALSAAGVGGGGWPFAACVLAGGAAAGVCGGYAAGRALRAAPLAAALALAAATCAAAAAGILANGGATPLWYWGGLQLVLLPLAVCAGGLLHARPAARR
jgi:hypothetical protein